MYQPALEYGKIDDCEAYNYVFHKPTTLSPYLKNFLPPNIEHEEDPDEIREVLYCKGIKDVNPAHHFLKAEGHYKCSVCLTCFCRTCGYSPSKDRDGKKQRQKV